jgi:hypothetical protein
LELLADVVKKSIVDIQSFSQKACSSPHVFFVEKGNIHIKKIAHFFKIEMDSAIMNVAGEESASTNVLNARFTNYFDLESDVMGDENFKWTILLGNNIEFNNPIGSNTIYLKEVESFDKVLCLINRSIQCVSLAVKNPERRKILAKEILYLGADRCTLPGKMHAFTYPWDGLFPLERLARHTSLC